MKNKYNMIPIILYYWFKLYDGQLKERDNYSKLSRIICILNFSYLNNERFYNELLSLKILRLMTN